MKISIESLFRDYEETEYNIKFFQGMGDIKNIGKIISQMRKKEEEIEILNEIKIFSPEIEERNRIILSKKEFKPLFYESIIETSKEVIQVKGEYKPQKIIVRLFKSQEKRELKIKPPNFVFDNSSVFYILRIFAFNLLEDIRQFYIANLNIGKIVLAEVEPIEEEIIKCRFGEFQCIGIRMKLPEYPNLPYQTFFYRKETPTYLVKSILGKQVVEISELR
jgi:hypothetical protein